VVIITGYGTTENESRAKAAGVTDFVRKPLSPEMIEQSAAHALREAAPEVAPEAVQAPMEQVHVEVIEKESRIKNIALFLAAPFIGLAYAVMLPVVGVVMLAKVALQARKAKNQQV
jgi:CheY-like chemotaxis protein